MSEIKVLTDKVLAYQEAVGKYQLDVTEKIAGVREVMSGMSERVTAIHSTVKENYKNIEALSKRVALVEDHPIVCPLKEENRNIKIEVSAVKTGLDDHIVRHKESESSKKDWKTGYLIPIVRWASMAALIVLGSLIASHADEIIEALK